MEGFVGALAIGSFSFYLLTVVCALITILLVNRECPYWSVLCLFSYALYLDLIAKQHVFGYIASHPLKILLYVIAYLLVGFAWSFVKWWLFVNKEALVFKAKRYSWMESCLKSRLSKAPQDNVLKQQLEGLSINSAMPSCLESDYSSTYFAISAPKVSDCVKSITLWILYWPISLLLVLMGDLITKVVHILIEKCRVVYESITKNAFKVNKE